MDKRRIRFEWPELGLSAYASLADEVNPELCEEIWNALPFESIMNNAVVTDGSMYCWVPVLSFAPVRHKERIDQAPVGRIRYSQNTGNKVIVQYGACNEDVMGAVLGQIDEEDLPTVERVGAEARNAIFMTKKEIHVHISRVNETEKAGRSHETLKRPQTCRKDFWS